MATSLLALLAACEEGQNPLAALTAGGGSGGGAAVPVAAGGEVIERDVEAPEVFSATDEGLWDGRPSLGGIWVAHPDVTSPERVRVRNTATGQETTGALFRREREMPGPRIQVSSEAAAALGMVAGAPVELTVVAIKRERIEVAPPPGEGETATAGALAPGAIEATPLDAAGTAAAAVSAVSSAPPPTSDARPAARPSRPAEPPAPAPAAAEEPPAAPAEPPAAAPEAPAAAPEAPSEQAPAAEAQAPLAGGSFIQVGIFSQESNAEGAAATLRGAGMVPAVRSQDSNGRTVWRVLVGPVATAADRAALLEKVRELGFADAYVIRN